MISYGLRGPPGPPGSGSGGGASAFTTTTASYVQPAIGATVVVSVRNAKWIAVGQVLYVENGGTYTVTAVPTTKSVTLENDGGTNPVAGTVIPSGSKVIPGGGAVFVNVTSPLTGDGSLVSPLAIDEAALASDIAGDGITASGSKLDAALSVSSPITGAGTSGSPVALDVSMLATTLAGAGLVANASALDVTANADGSIKVNANDVQVGVLATDAQHGARGGGTQHATAVANGDAGFLSGADKAKLDGITPDAAVASVGATAPITSTGGSTPNIGITAATTLASGSMSAADKAKLDALPSNGIHVTAPVTGDGSAGSPIAMAAATSVVSGYMTFAYASKLDGLPSSFAGGTGISLSTVGGVMTITATNAGAVTSVGASSPITSTGGATPNIGINLALVVDTSLAHTAQTAEATYWAGGTPPDPGTAISRIASMLAQAFGEQIPAYGAPPNVDIKEPALAVAIVPVVALTGLAVTVDGILLSTIGTRVLLTAQTDPKQNGLWLTQTLAWTRPLDFATGSAADGAYVEVLKGTLGADSSWLCTTDPPNDIVDTNNLAWSRNPQGYVTSVSGTAPVASSGGTTPAISLAYGNGLINSSGTLSPDYGTTSGTITQGNDTRLAPTPTAVGKLVYDTGSAYGETAAGTDTKLLQGNASGAPTWQTPSGDVSYAAGGAHTVIGLQGRGFDATAPSTGQAVVYNGTTWAPGNPTASASVAITTGTSLPAASSSNVGQFYALQAASSSPAGDGEQIWQSVPRGASSYTWRQVSPGIWIPSLTSSTNYTLTPSASNHGVFTVTGGHIHFAGDSSFFGANQFAFVDFTLPQTINTRRPFRIQWSISNATNIPSTSTYLYYIGAFKFGGVSDGFRLRHLGTGALNISRLRNGSYQEANGTSNFTGASFAATTLALIIDPMRGSATLEWYNGTRWQTLRSYPYDNSTLLAVSDTAADSASHFAADLPTIEICVDNSGGANAGGLSQSFDMTLQVEELGVTAQ